MKGVVRFWSTNKNVHFTPIRIMEQRKKKIKCEIYRDSFQNSKRYGIPKAQLIIADVPYNVGTNFYGSNPMWYNGGDNKNGESKLAGKSAFNSDFNFNLYEYFHFCSRMLVKDDTKPLARGRSSNSPCMIVFCSFEQLPTLIDAGKKHGLYSEENPYGWNIGFLHFSLSQLDEKEQYFIKLYAQNGFQLRNKTAGGQGEGKVQINEYRPTKGYRDGIKQGKITLARELTDIIGKHLTVSIREDKKFNKVSIKALEKFNALIDEDNYK